MRRTTCLHVIFGVDLEKPDVRPVRQDFRHVLALEADTGALRQGGVNS
jgi:hypothetical protein